jgi:mycobactin peptide synthetase MbtE
LRATGKRARWTSDGHLDVIEVDAPAPSAAFAGATGSFEPVRTETERTLAAMLAEALEVPEVGRNDNFFSLGGDSIMAVQLAARARDAGIPLTARMVFEHPTIHELAATVDNADGESQSADAHHDPMAASGLSDDELAAVSAWFSTTGSASEDGAP